MTIEKSSPKLCQALFLAVVIALSSAFCPSAGAATITKDKVNAYPGTLSGNADFTANGGGHTAKPGDFAIDLTPAGGYVNVADATFLNAATTNDELSVALWVKKYDIANSSAFWFVSPSSPSSSRGFQAHTPWSDNTIYFDTAGCCGADTRISANISTFPDYAAVGDNSWWTNKWRLFVFSKKADVKQIWIDGVLFLEGSGTAMLHTDFTFLNIGADSANGGQMHGLVDDFSIYSKQLTENQITNLLAGTLPTALSGSPGLIAYWDFNDFPPEGSFSTILPTPNATDADPNLVRVVHRDGVTPWATTNVSLKVDNVTVATTFTKVGDRATISYVPSPVFVAQSKHTASLTYPGPTGAPTTLDWKFTVGVYTRDRVLSRLGSFKGASTFSDSSGGRTAKPGDYALDTTLLGGGVEVSDASFMNAATTNDEMSVAIWIKRYDIANSSVFWVDSPSQSRVFQAHAPWSDNVVYFDTGGTASTGTPSACCGGTETRISDTISDFPDFMGDTTDISWWTNNWHLFVFTKKADAKQIWIDGKMFLTGSSLATLSTDIGRLRIGGQPGGGNLMHGLIDDFSVYSKALTESDITNLFKGTLPTALPSTAGLLAYWDFNDIPAGGLITTIIPAPDSSNAVPNLVKVVHLDGSSAWNPTNVSLKVDNAIVTATKTKTGGLLTVSYVPSPLFTGQSAHTATLLYSNASVLDWQFTVGTYTRDVIRSNIGVLAGAAKFTPDGGGKSGKPGDRGLDFGAANAGQSVQIIDASFLNIASTNDEMAIVSWQKLYQIADSALFWGISPSTGSGNRGFSAHTPWSNNTLYFDTAGCCDAALQRINASITTFPDYSGDVSWWTNWHHLVFQKKLSTKEIWIDGKLFLTGDNTNPLPTDFTIAWLGFDPPDNARLRGVIDDFAVYATALSEGSITNLAGVALPNSLPASTKLLAYWNFNDAPVGGPTIAIARGAGATLTITYTGTLQSATTLGGTWSNVGGATSPFPVTPAATAGGVFYRSSQ